MSATTLCPTCNTRFRVSREQLEAHQGLVRCGRCQAVFNAAEFLQEDGASLQLDLPMTAQQLVEVVPHEPVPHESVAPVITPVEHEEPADTGIVAPQPIVVEPAEPAIPEQADTFAEPIETTYAEPVRKKRTWPWLFGSLVMLAVLLAQAAYFFRVELAAIRPDLKPALISYCSLLNCTVPLPQNADLMDIESSELEADPAQSSVIALSALLRNHAPYAQAYPNLELSLTDAQEKPLARRTFHPAEYLKPGDDEKQGLAANRELGVKLNLDTTDLKPSGYRLFLYYSQ